MLGELTGLADGVEVGESDACKLGDALGVEIGLLLGENGNV